MTATPERAAELILETIVQKLNRAANEEVPDRALRAALKAVLTDAEIANGLRYATQDRAWLCFDSTGHGPLYLTADGFDVGSG